MTSKGGSTAVGRPAEAARDRGWVERARAGDGDAFALLVARYGQPILSLAYSSTLDRAEAEDLAQEIFLLAWRNLGRFRGDSSFATWLFALARNACIDRARRMAVRPRLAVAPEDAAELAFEESDPLTVTALLETAARLSLPLRQALLLRDVQGRSYEEIARLQEVPIGTVRSRIAAARATIAEELER